MDKVKSILTARTENSNNGFSDMQRYVVSHVVEVQLESGLTKEITIMAEDPMDAIQRCQNTLIDREVS